MVESKGEVKPHGGIDKIQGGVGKIPRGGLVKANGALVKPLRGDG